MLRPLAQRAPSRKTSGTLMLGCNSLRLITYMPKQLLDCCYVLQGQKRNLQTRATIPKCSSGLIDWWYDYILSSTRLQLQWQDEDNFFQTCKSSDMERTTEMLTRQGFRMTVGSPTTTSGKNPGLRYTCLKDIMTRGSETNDFPKQPCPAGIMAIHHFPCESVIQNSRR